MGQNNSGWWKATLVWVGLLSCWVDPPHRKGGESAGYLGLLDQFSMVRYCMLDLWWEEANDSRYSLALNYPVLFFDTAAFWRCNHILSCIGKSVRKCWASLKPSQPLQMAFDRLLAVWETPQGSSWWNHSQPQFTADLVAPISQPSPVCSGCASNIEKLFRSYGALQETKSAEPSLLALLCRSCCLALSTLL